MLARAGKIPTGKGWSFEPKLDGFRAIASTCGASPIGRATDPAPACAGRKIAAELNAADVPTAQGGREWYAATVRHVLLRTS